MRIRLWMCSALLAVGFSTIAANHGERRWVDESIENDEKESYVLSLEEAKDLALTYNVTLKNAGLSIDKANAAMWEAIAQGLPQVNATVDYTTFFGASNTIEMAPGASTTIDFNNTSNLNATVSQLIFSGAYIVGLQAAKLYEEMVAKTAEKSELDVKQQVANAYYAILLAEKTKDILEQNLENVMEIRSKTEMMYKTGVAESTDVDQLSIQVTMLESSLRTTARNTSLAYDILKLQMGITPNAKVELTQSIDDFFEPESFYSSLLRAFNVEEHVDYQLADQQVEVSDKQVKLAKMEYLPTIGAAYNHLEQILAPKFNMNPKNTLTFNMNIPIFSSGQRKAKVKQAKIDLETAENNMQQLNDALLAKDRTIKTNLKTALDQYDAQMKNVEVAKRVFNNIDRKYEAGMVSSLDLTTANTNYLNAESSYIQAMLDVLEAFVELERFYNNI
ncbi:MULTISPECIES: TolC family protein [unclassified Carboxylicivirga]|uniref:TolC family protein n=1 Tax=Carboxylicivirga TaxID=1628153 RepID=UPI003D3581B7